MSFHSQNNITLVFSPVQAEFGVQAYLNGANIGRYAAQGIFNYPDPQPPTFVFNLYDLVRERAWKESGSEDIREKREREDIREGRKKKELEKKQKTNFFQASWLGTRKRMEIDKGMKVRRGIKEKRTEETR